MANEMSLYVVTYITEWAALKKQHQPKQPMNTMALGSILRG